MGEETAFVVLQFIAQEFINVVEKERLVLVLRQGTYVVITLKYCSSRELVAPLENSCVVLHTHYSNKKGVSV